MSGDTPIPERSDCRPLIGVEALHVPVVINGMQIGTIQTLAPGLLALQSIGPTTVDLARSIGHVVLEGAPEPFGGPRVADALVRAAEFLKAKGWRPTGSGVAANG